MMHTPPRMTLISCLAFAALAISACSTESPAASVAESTKAVGDIGKLNDYALPDVGTTTKTYKVAVLQAHRSDAYAQSTAIAVEEYAKAHDVDVTVQDAGGYDGVAVQKQIGQIEAATSNGVDAIVIWSTDPTAIAPALAEASGQGIKIIAWSQAPDFAGADATVTGDFVADGKTMATALFNRIGGDGKVISIFGGAGSAYEAALSEGFEQAAADFPDVEVVASPTIDDFSPAKVQESVSNYLTKNPDLEGVVTTTGQMAVAATNAIDAAGKTGATFAVGEILGDCSQVTLLKQGKLPILLGVPAIYSGQLVMATTIQVLEGVSVPKTQIIPGNVYTPDNIDEAPLDLEVAPEFLEGCA